MFFSRYLSLVRTDVCAIGFIGYLIGVQLEGSVSGRDIWVALAVALLSTNFIYTFNQWSDWRIDSISKPERSIPSGKVTPLGAFWCAMTLLVGAVIYPFFVTESNITRALFLLLPALGIVYSARPFWLKRFSGPSVLITSVGLVTPILLGHLSQPANHCKMSFIAAVFLFCVGLVLLKDIEDVEGDQRFAIQNLFTRYGQQLLVMAVGCLLADLILVLVFPLGNLLRTFMIVMIGSSMILIICWRTDLRLLYRNLIRVTLLEGLLFVTLSRL